MERITSPVPVFGEPAFRVLVPVFMDYKVQKRPQSGHVVGGNSVQGQLGRTAFIQPGEMKVEGEILFMSTATYRKSVERISGSKLWYYRTQRT